MKKRVSLFIAFLLYRITSFATYDAEQANIDVPHADYLAAYSRLERAWRSGLVETLVIVHVPTESEYALEFTAPRLDSECTFQLTVRAPKEQVLGQELLVKLAATHASFSGEHSPLRWGFIFISQKRERLYSIYVDKTGRRGVVDGDWVGLDSNVLFRWVEFNLGTALH